MRQAGIPAAELHDLIGLADTLPNLQLLDSADNVHKSHTLPKEWFDGLSPTAKRFYTTQGVKYLPDGLDGFERFWTTRRDFLERRIRALLKGTAW